MTNPCKQRISIALGGAGVAIVRPSASELVPPISLLLHIFRVLPADAKHSTVIWLVNWVPIRNTSAYDRGRVGDSNLGTSIHCTIVHGGWHATFHPATRTKPQVEHRMKTMSLGCLWEEMRIGRPLSCSGCLPVHLYAITDPGSHRRLTRLEQVVRGSREVGSALHV